VDSGVTAGTYGPTADKTLSYGGSFKVPKVKVNAKGLVTVADEYTITLPEKQEKIKATLLTDEDINETVESSGNLRKFYLTAVKTQETAEKQLYFRGDIYIQKEPDKNGAILMGAAWNDYAEYRAQIQPIEPGYCVISNDKGEVDKTN
jgi:hypothetical protein